MKTIDIIRAWKDEAYRSGLTVAEQAALPANPVGSIDLTDAELNGVAGGRPYISNRTCTVNDKICCSSGDLCAPD
jgi:mersacidin/lichenicidin family type 2 lantibiotic